MNIDDMKEAIRDLEWQELSISGKASLDVLRKAIEKAEKREWVSLTDEEFEQIVKELSHNPRLLAVEIEARLTEKNI
jgi:arsenate reductase-like glutaredoxin family protein